MYKMELFIIIAYNKYNLKLLKTIILKIIFVSEVSSGFERANYLRYG